MRLPISFSDLLDRSIAPAPLFAAKGRTTFEQGYLVLLSLAAVNFVANYLFIANFGFYEDDYLLTLPFVGQPFHDIANTVKSVLRHLTTGRPIWWALQVSLSWLLGLTTAIWPFHLFSFALTSGTAFAVFAFLRRFVSLPAAFLAAVFYLLFPVDASKQIFMHQLSFGLPTLMLLAAYSLYLRRKPVKAHLLGAAILLTYEPYFLLLFFMPALGYYKGKREMIVSLIRNAAVLTLVLFLVLLVRKGLGDGRAADVLSGELPTYLGRALQAPWIGGWTALRMCIARPLESLLHASMPQRLLSAGGAAMVFTTGWLLWKARKPESEIDKGSASTGGLSRGLRVQFIGLGLAMFLFPYIYRFYPDYFPPNVNIGRLSALHSVGVFGLCLSIAMLLDWVLAARERLGIPLIAAAGIYFGLLVGFGVEVQETQYVKNWEQQKAVLQSLLGQIGDLDENDIVLVEFDLPPGTTVDRRPYTEGFTYHWLLYDPIKVFPRLFETLEGREANPLLYPVWNDAPMERVPEGLKISTPPIGSEVQPVLSNGEFLLFEWTDDGVVRSAKPIVFEGEEFLPKPPSESTSRRHPTTWFYEMLFKTDDRPLWPTFSRSRFYPDPG